MDIKLIIQQGDRAGQIIPLDTSDFIVGRDPGSNYQIDHPMVDIRHARFHLFGGRVSVEDLKTENGTAVNDKYIRRIELRNGDRIKIGPTTFHVALDADPKDLDRRVEAWCANTLEARSKQVLPGDQESLVDSATSDMARKILGKLSSREGRVGGRSRLRVGESAGITVVKFVDTAILQDTDIQEIEHELTDLVDSGHRRIVLHFGNVENLSSQMAPVLLKLNEMCEDHGGLLKICKLMPKVSSMVVMTGLDKQIMVVRDERVALEGDWPDGTAPASEEEEEDASKPQWPDEIPLDWGGPDSAPLDPATGSALAPASAPAPSAARQPAESLRVGPGSSTLQRTAPAPSPEVAPAPAATRVGLIVASGKSEGQFIKVPGPSFLIGSDPMCQLRPKSSTVAPMHAVIERRGERVILRDLRTESGTSYNDRTLRGEEVDVTDGDRLRVGPLSFRFSIGARAGHASPRPSPDRANDPNASWVFAGAETPEPAPLDDLAAGWLLDGPAAVRPIAQDAASKRLAQYAEKELEKIDAPPSPPAQPARPAGPAAKATHHVSHEVIQDVLVLKILTPDLSDETTVAPIRAELQDIFERPLPRRVVLSLECVTYLSSRAVGMLLAYFQRLQRAGGKMRLCHVRPRVMPTLDQMRLPSLMEVYPTVDEALLAAW